MTSAVVFAYSEVGVRCLHVLLRHGVRMDLVFTHDDDPAEQQWFSSVAEVARTHRLPLVSGTNPNAPGWIRQVEELLGALSVHLDASDLKKLDQVSSQ